MAEGLYVMLVALAGLGAGAVGAITGLIYAVIGLRRGERGWARTAVGLSVAWVLAAGGVILWGALYG